MLSARFRASTLKDQITLSVTAGVLLIVIPATLVNIWLGWSHLEESSLRQGKQVTSALAQQSKLALLYDAPANAEEFARGALSFPGVIRIEIVRANGEILLQKGEQPAEMLPKPAKATLATHPHSNDSNIEKALDEDPISIAAEGMFSWKLASPVVMQRAKTDIDGDDMPPTIIGEVRVYQRKALLGQNVKHLLLVQFGVLVLVAGAVLLFVRRWVGFMAAPLISISSAMSFITQDSVWSKVDVTGPQDIRDMAISFNTLIDTLSERENALDVAMQRQRLLMNHLHEAREEQSRAIARELHDSIGGNLTTLKLRLAMVLEDIEEDNPIRTQVTDLHNLSLNTLQQTKHITAMLRPTMLDTLGLAASLRWLVDEFSRTTKAHSKIALSAADNLSADKTVAIFRIAQEALTNASRHSGCTELVLSTETDADSYRMIICDNGRGFDTRKTLDNISYGLMNMHERALFIGGELLLFSTPGNGVRLEVNVPLSTAVA
jgi:signal transduction histidine kinase